ncbi:MAG: glycerophosphodiester phosphodiesterase family protein [Aestuariivita sp.]|uniref:glycerophosphodiester phosphodiesterase family protein n=1 Tax=Aestuariivita sp. TaxID=1872407 RepID=UPI003BAF119D
MTDSLPASFLDVPLAHRAYHDRDMGRPENSLAAVTAAIEAGYGIEIDVQLSSDGEAMVFHDYDLARLTGEQGPIRARSASELSAIALTGGEDCIPTLSRVLSLVAGRAPLLIEIKDQDGAMGPDVGPLEAATAKALGGYEGPVAVMSFNPHSVAAMAKLAPGIPRGLTTSAYDPADWPLSKDTCDRLREIPDIERTGACFISHEATDLTRPRVTALRASGLAVLSWTVKSQAQEDAVRPFCDNITFEGYAARR